MSVASFALHAFNADHQMIALVPLVIESSPKYGVWLASGTAACFEVGKPVKVSVALGDYVLWSGPARKRYLEWLTLGNEPSPPRMSVVVKCWPFKLQAMFKP